MLNRDFLELMENFGGYLRQKNDGIVAENCAYRFRKIEEYKYTYVKVVLYNFWMFTNIYILRSLMLNLG